MNILTQQLLTAITQLNREIRLPDIDRVYLPKTMLSTSEATAKHDKFGLVTLKDGSCGLFYRLLDTIENSENSQNINYETVCRELAVAAEGKPVEEIAQWLSHEGNFARGIGLGAINAATDSLFRQAGFDPEARSAQARHQPAAGTNVGLVGYFSQQVKQLMARGHNVTVLELDEQLHQQTQGLVVSAELESLQHCQTIYCTASTLINQTLHGLVQALAGDRHFELIGPSAGCFPDALFAAGVKVIGGSRIIDPNATSDLIERGLPWSDSVKKFQMTPENYPGLATLLNQARLNQTR